MHERYKFLNQNYLFKHAFLVFILIPLALCKIPPRERCSQAIAEFKNNKFQKAVSGYLTAFDASLNIFREFPEGIFLLYTQSKTKKLQRITLDEKSKTLKTIILQFIKL